VNDGDRPVRNPHVVLREEFDDWAVLFNPDSGRGFGLNPTGVYLWKLLDGRHSVGDLLAALCHDASGVPSEAGERLVTFLEGLVNHGLTVHEEKREDDDRASPSPRPLCRHDAVTGPVRFPYETPALVDFGGGQVAHGDCLGGSHDSDNCQDGGGAGKSCWSGPSPTYNCQTGTSAGYGCLCTGNSPGWANACWAGNCPQAFSQTCADGGTLCQNGGSALRCTTCGVGGRGN